MPLGDYVLRLEGILPTGACLSFGLLFLTIFSYAAFFAPAPAEPPRKGPPCADMKRFQPVILVTIGWCALYFCFLQGQGAAAFWIHRKRRQSFSKKQDDPSSPGRALARPNSGSSIPFASVKYGPRAEVQPGLIFVMDRSVGNLLEQTPPFLLGLWLHALAASPTTAARLGWWWLMLRASYPVAFAYPSMSPSLWGVQRRLGISWVSFVTWPSYVLVWSLLYGAADVCW